MKDSRKKESKTTDSTYTNKRILVPVIIAIVLLVSAFAYYRYFVLQPDSRTMSGERLYQNISAYPYYELDLSNMGFDDRAMPR